jgi:Ca-activated chloride channel family protein
MMKMGRVTGRNNMYADNAESTFGIQTRQIGNKTFYFNGKQWIDTATTSHKDQKKVTITFMSEDYFKLLKDHPELGKFLALGENILVSFNGTTYEIKK